jgi:hypothetical protein
VAIPVSLWARGLAWGLTNNAIAREGGGEETTGVTRKKKVTQMTKSMDERPKVQGQRPKKEGQRPKVEKGRKMEEEEKDESFPIPGGDFDQQMLQLKPGVKWGDLKLPGRAGGQGRAGCQSTYCLLGTSSHKYPCPVVSNIALLSLSVSFS